MRKQRIVQHGSAWLCLLVTPLLLLSCGRPVAEDPLPAWRGHNHPAVAYHTADEAARALLGPAVMIENIGLFRPRAEFVAGEVAAGGLYLNCRLNTEGLWEVERIGLLDRALHEDALRDNGLRPEEISVSATADTLSGENWFFPEPLRQQRRRPLLIEQPSPDDTAAVARFQYGYRQQQRFAPMLLYNESALYLSRPVAGRARAALDLVDSWAQSLFRGGTGPVSRTVTEQFVFANYYQLFSPAAQQGLAGYKAVGAWEHPAGAASVLAAFDWLLADAVVRQFALLRIADTGRGLMITAVDWYRPEPGGEDD